VELHKWVSGELVGRKTLSTETVIYEAKMLLSFPIFAPLYHYTQMGFHIQDHKPQNSKKVFCHQNLLKSLSNTLMLIFLPAGTAGLAASLLWQWEKLRQRRKFKSQHDCIWLSSFRSLKLFWISRREAVWFVGTLHTAALRHVVRSVDASLSRKCKPVV